MIWCFNILLTSSLLKPFAIVYAFISKTIEDNSTKVYVKWNKNKQQILSVTVYLTKTESDY